MSIENTNGEEQDFLPKPKKNAWIYLFAAFVIVGIATLTLRYVYRSHTLAQKNKSFGLIKRTIPARYSNYTLIFSSAEKNIADELCDEVAKEISSDSLITEMVVAGTAIYQHTASLREYQELIKSGLARAQDADIYKQSLLFSQIVGVMQMDTLPVRLHLVGKISSHEGELPERFAATVRDLSVRHEKIGRVEVVSHLRPDNSDDAKKFLSYFEEKNIPLARK